MKKSSGTTRNATTRLAVLSGLLLSSSAAVHGQAYTVTDLGILPGKLSTSVYGNHSLNNAGRVVGHCNAGDLVTGLFGDYFTENVAFVWSEGGGIQPLPLLPGRANATGYSLNDRGQIIGNAGNSMLDLHGVLWEKGVAKDLGVLPGKESGVKP